MHKLKLNTSFSKLLNSNPRSLLAVPDLRGHRDPSSSVVLGRPTLQTPHDRLFRSLKCRRSTSEKCHLEKLVERHKIRHKS